MPRVGSSTKGSSKSAKKGQKKKKAPLKYVGGKRVATSNRKVKAGSKKKKTSTGSPTKKTATRGGKKGVNPVSKKSVKKGAGYKKLQKKRYK